MNLSVIRSKPKSKSNLKNKKLLLLHQEQTVAETRSELDNLKILKMALNKEDRERIEASPEQILQLLLRKLLLSKID